MVNQSSSQSSKKKQSEKRRKTTNSTRSISPNQQVKQILLDMREESSRTKARQFNAVNDVSILFFERKMIYTVDLDYSQACFKWTSCSLYAIVNFIATLCCIRQSTLSRFGCRLSSLTSKRIFWLPWIFFLKTFQPLEFPLKLTIKSFFWIKKAPYLGAP